METIKQSVEKTRFTILVRIMVIGILFFGAHSYLSAQVNPRALGLRFGAGSVFGAEISYQHGLSDKNRFEADLGFGASRDHNRFFVAGIYHWVWNLNDGLNWYIGPGAAAGFYSYDVLENYLNIGVGGQIGLEYDFNTLDAPFLLSIDVRPMWDFIGHGSGLGWGLSLGARYTW